MRDIKYSFARLSRSKKVVFIASLVSVIGCLMPWYNDLSVYGATDTFLGITGPLFLAGFFVLVMSGFVALMIGMPMMGKNFLKLPVKQSIVAMAVGVQSLFLLLIVNSVFYHSKFGVSISHKSPGFGMTISMVAVIGLIVGSYFWYKEEYVYKGFDESIGRKEPLIRMESAPPVQQKTENREQRSIDTETQPHTPYSKKATRRGFGFKESRPGESIDDLVKKQQPQSSVIVDDTPPPMTNANDDTDAISINHGGKEENMKIRLDL